MKTIAVVLAIACASTARAESAERTITWPYTLSLHVVAGAEPHPQGVPVAFGVGGEGLWRGLIGIFASVMGSAGLPINPAPDNGMPRPNLPDRVSVPFGLVLRPFALTAAKGEGWGWRMLAGIGVQLGLTVEHLRTSAEDSTVAGLHLGFSFDIPLNGGPLDGGIAIRFAGRMIAAPSVSLQMGAVQEPAVAGQILLGFCYTP